MKWKMENGKWKILLISGILFLGCANNQVDIPKAPKYSLIEKYQVSETSLQKIKNGYVFFKTGVAGAEIYYLDKNYNLIKKVVTPIVIEPKKLKVEDNKIYILGNHNYRPIVLVYDSNGKLVDRYYVGEKYDVPVDIEDAKVLLTKYDNGSYISFDGVNIKHKNSLTAEQVVKFNGGYIIFGTIQDKTEDLFIAFVKNKKIAWIRVYDFGMDDGVESVKVKNNKIYLDVYTTDYMGARIDYKVILNEKGEIIKKSKSLEFKELPLKFRT